ncbi:hypothetical protein JIN77_02510 [Verrucomicrobiaceae bacterium R5-34]|nr:hypothetical protein [Verrucomicrobiaceae bacterium R5-34]
MTTPLNPYYYATWFECSRSILPDEFVIITANNPNGETISTQNNEELNLKLIKHLDSLGLD